MFFGGVPVSPPILNVFQTTLQNLKLYQPELTLSFIVGAITFDDLYAKNKQQYELLIHRTKDALEEELAKNKKFQTYHGYWQKFKAWPNSIHQTIMLFSQFKAYSRIQNKVGSLDIEQQELFRNRFQFISQIKKIFPFDDIHSLLSLQEEKDFILQNLNKKLERLPSKEDIETFIFSTDYKNSLPDNIKFFYSPFESHSIQQRQVLVSLMAEGELYKTEIYDYFCRWVSATINSLIIGQLIKLRPKKYHAASFFPNLLFDIMIKRAKTLQSNRHSYMGD